MNNKANSNNPTKTKVVNKSKVTKWIVGGIVVAVGVWEILKYRKRRQEEHNKSVDEKEETKAVEEPQVEKDLIDMVQEAIEKDFLFSGKDLLSNLTVIRTEEDDTEDGIDYTFPQFILIEEKQGENGRDNYISLTFKFYDEIKSPKRDDEDSDPEYTKLRKLVEDTLDLKYEYGKNIRWSSKALGFYVEGGKELTYRELRNLDVLSGVRYIEFRFFNLEFDKELGVEFLMNILKECHPEGGEDEELDYMPIIISRVDEILSAPITNNVIKKFLRSKGEGR